MRNIYKQWQRKNHEITFSQCSLRRMIENELIMIDFLPSIRYHRDQMVLDFYNEEDWGHELSFSWLFWEITLYWRNKNG